MPKIDATPWLWKWSGHEWGVADAVIEDFTLLADGVEGAQEFGDGGGEVPPMHEHDVDVVRLELLQAGVEAEVESFWCHYPLCRRG